MKIFPNYDYDLCDNNACTRKLTCKRYLTYLKAVEEKYPYPVYLIIPNKPKCRQFVKA